MFVRHVTTWADLYQGHLDIDMEMDVDGDVDADLVLVNTFQTDYTSISKDDLESVTNPFLQLISPPSSLPTEQTEQTEEPEQTEGTELRHRPTLSSSDNPDSLVIPDSPGEPGESGELGGDVNTVLPRRHVHRHRPPVAVITYRFDRPAVRIYVYIIIYIYTCA